MADRTSTAKEYFLQNHFLYVFTSILFALLIGETVMTHFWRLNDFEVTMNLFRAIIGNAALWKPKKTMRRIIFLLAIFSSMIMNLCLQSELTSSATVKPLEKFEIDSVEDLMSKQYEVFVPRPFAQHFLSTRFYSQIRTPDYGCPESITSNFSIACAHGCYYLKNLAKLPKNAKVFADRYLKGYRTAIFPIDYPLLPRIKKNYYNLHEGGFILRTFEEMERKSVEKGIVPDDTVALEDVKYVCYLLVFAILFTVVVFFAEIVVKKYFDQDDLKSLFKDTFFLIKNRFSNFVEYFKQ